MQVYLWISTDANYFMLSLVSIDIIENSVYSMIIGKTFGKFVVYNYFVGLPIGVLNLNLKCNG